MPSTPLFARCWPALAIVSLLLVAPSALAQRVSARDKAAAEVLNERMAAAEKRYRDALVLSANSDPKGTTEGDAALEDMEAVSYTHLDVYKRQRPHQTAVGKRSLTGVRRRKTAGQGQVSSGRLSACRQKYCP